LEKLGSRMIELPLMTDPHPPRDDGRSGKHPACIPKGKEPLPSRPEQLATSSTESIRIVLENDSTDLDWVVASRDNFNTNAETVWLVKI
ncbi:MAG TPA: hypothetical protein VNV63_06815, partial [Nitrospiria bacterium]|nr:hypothetical protein [Nitrospiria bacterium]